MRRDRPQSGHGRAAGPKGTMCVTLVGGGRKDRDPGPGPTPSDHPRKRVAILPSEKPGTLEQDFRRSVHTLDAVLTGERGRSVGPPYGGPRRSAALLKWEAMARSSAAAPRSMRASTCGAGGRSAFAVHAIQREVSASARSARLKPAAGPRPAPRLLAAQDRLLHGTARANRTAAARARRSRAAAGFRRGRETAESAPDDPERPRMLLLRGGGETEYRHATIGGRYTLYAASKRRLR